MPAVRAASQQRISEQLSIGRVLELLHGEFADLTPSKLRFLEEQGLVTPLRTRSGYRKFTQSHVERLRLILTLQREHYLPLKVIAEILRQLDEGRDPLIPGAGIRSVSSILSPKRVLSREELQAMTGASQRFIGEAIAAGLLPPAEVFASEVAAELSALLQLSEQGITPRHLRAMRVAAERDAELIAQSIEARGSRGSSPEAGEESLTLVECLETIRGGVLRRRLMR